MYENKLRSGCGVLPTIYLLIFMSSVSLAPTPRSLASMVSIDTTGLEVPSDFLAASDSGTGALQIVVNIRTDIQGNIENKETKLLSIPWIHRAGVRPIALQREECKQFLGLATQV